jgi:Cu2+-containing amine oxidase
MTMTLAAEDRARDGRSRPHPLSPLTPTEIRVVVGIVRADAGSAMR